MFEALSPSRVLARPAPARRRLMWWCLGFIVVALVPQLIRYLWLDGPGKVLNDFEVYRDAGVSVLTGRPVYEHLTDGRTALPFTYPPISALLAVPLTFVPERLAGVGWTLANIGVLAAIVARVTRPTVRRYGDWAPLALAVLVVLALWMAPPRTTFNYGQVNLLLVALVLADCTARSPRWPRGLLIGIATAVKLTPAVFIAYLWFTGRRRAAGVAAATAAGLTLLAFVVLPDTSIAYWGPDGALFQSDRLGNNADTSNQSIRGMLLRATSLGDGARNAIWLVACAVVAVIGFGRATRASRDGDELIGVTLVGLLAVLLSPVAWLHHLCWLVLGLAALLGDLRDRRLVVWAGAVWLLFTLRLPYYGSALTNLDIPLQLAWDLLRDAYGLVAVVLIAALPWRRGGHDPATELPSESVVVERGLAPGA